LTSFEAAGFLREGEEVRARHRIHNFTFDGFYDICYAGFFDSDDKWIHASSQFWCYLCHAYFCHGA
jgi:hypothetical protein